ncbi:hypothetical protein RUM44_003894 [Polyplax serrata]|uniref:Uncharacterized protein n=1 Tax=Polyplax serrata TaxID=468196 RepID=A0ABR1B1A0_POLSC
MSFRGVRQMEETHTERERNEDICSNGSKRQQKNICLIKSRRTAGEASREVIRLYFNRPFYRGRRSSGNSTEYLYEIDFHNYSRLQLRPPAGSERIRASRAAYSSHSRQRCHGKEELVQGKAAAAAGEEEKKKTV